MRTKAQCRTRVRTILVDPNSEVWTDSEIDYHMIESYGAMVYQAQLLYARAAIADVASQALYNLPTDFQQIIRCTYDGATIPQLDETTLSVNDKSFLTVTGQVIGYSIDDINGQLRKWKIPAANDATAFQIEYYKRGAALAADGTAFQIPLWATDIMEYRVVAKCLEQEGEGQDLKGSAWWMKRFMRGMYQLTAKKRTLVKFNTMVMGGSTARGGGPAYPRLPWPFSGPARVGRR